jgi:hypothetical protein
MKHGEIFNPFRCPLQEGEEAAILLDYCARRLDPEQARILERHMGVCPRCRAMAEEQRRLWKALDDWEAEPPAVGFDRSLSEQAEFLEGKERWRRRLGSLMDGVSWKPALPAAAAFALWVFLASPGPAPKVPVTEQPEAQQLEVALEDLDMLEQFNLHAQ